MRALGDLSNFAGVLPPGGAVTLRRTGAMLGAVANGATLPDIERSALDALAVLTVDGRRYLGVIAVCDGVTLRSSARLLDAAIDGASPQYLAPVESELQFGDLTLTVPQGFRAMRYKQGLRDAYVLTPSGAQTFAVVTLRVIDPANPGAGDPTLPKRVSVDLAALRPQPGDDATMAALGLYYYLATGEPPARAFPFSMPLGDRVAVGQRQEYGDGQTAYAMVWGVPLDNGELLVLQFATLARRAPITDPLAAAMYRMLRSALEPTEDEAQAPGGANADE